MGVTQSDQDNANYSNASDEECWLGNQEMRSCELKTESWRAQTIKPSKSITLIS